MNINVRTLIEAIKMQNIAYGRPTNNTSSIVITLRKTGDPETDRAVKQFEKVTLSFLKEVQAECRSFWECISEAAIRSGADPDDFPTSEAFLDETIRYTFQKNKSERILTCFWDFRKISAAMDADTAQFPQAEVEKQAAQLGKDPSDPEEMQEVLDRLLAQERLDQLLPLISDPVMNENGGINYVIKPCFGEYGEDPMEHLMQLMDELFPKRHIFRYLTDLEIFEDEMVKEMLEDGVDFDDVLPTAALNFSVKYGEEAVKAKFCKFNECVIQAGNETEELHQSVEMVDLSYLTDAPKKLWHPNVREVAVVPYKLDDPEAGISVSMGDLEVYANLNLPFIPAEDIVRLLRKILDIYRGNCELAAAQGIDPEDLPEQCKPHIMVNDEVVLIDMLAILSEDIELLEIPLTPEGLDAEMQLTIY